MTVNRTQSKVMIISREEIQIHILINGEPFEQVVEFKYLGENNRYIISIL